MIRLLAALFECGGSIVKYSSIYIHPVRLMEFDGLDA